MKKAHGFNTIDGHDLKETFAAATRWLEKNAPNIDALNVFPVPDGDCGTNMLLTMLASIEEAYQVSDKKISSAARAMAEGALMGARGNSGVILSQIFKGIARSLDGKDTIGGQELADALYQASGTAYRALANPVEGTILTVARDAAQAALETAAEGNTEITAVLEAAVKSAGEAVAHTPELLPVLREAGVVDAGGQGLYTLLEGALLYLKGEIQQMQSLKPQLFTGTSGITPKSAQMTAEHNEPFGYCTQFMIKGDNLDPDELRRVLVDKGQSVIVVGDEFNIRVHIHTPEPASIISYAKSLGTTYDINIGNMDEQHRDFLVMQRERMLTADIAIVAVAAGKGLADLFTSLGASAIVFGGQTMNPSTGEILRAVEESGSDKIIILPNNKNVVLTAQQIESLTPKTIKVMPTEMIPQGVAALIAIDREADFETISRLMYEAIPTVKTIEITRATRSTSLDRLDIRKNQVIGLIDGKLSAAGDETIGVIINLLSNIDLAAAELITLYYGADTDETQAESLRARIGELYPHLETEVVNGGQPHYDYIIGIE